MNTLRDELAAALRSAASDGRTIAQPLHAASAVIELLGVPEGVSVAGIRRALAIAAAVDNATEDATPSGRAPVIDGHRSFYGYQVVKWLRAVTP